MASITVDQLQVLITANAKDLDEKLAKISQNMGGMSGDTSKATSSMSDAFKKVGDVGVKALKVGVVAAVAAVAASIPGAVKRIDTLVAFPRVLEAMGASSEQAAKATDTLATRLKGLPTPLQEGASGVQALVAAGLGVEEATDVFLAFNNATLAASTEAGAAQGAFTQLVQSISKGKIEGQEWNSMVAAMPTAFQALSKESGLTREELRELYRTDPQKLLDDLTKLDKEGGGGLASLEDQARAATGGIGTSFANMRNSIVRGLEGIVQQLGGGDLEAGQKKISDMVTKIGKAFEDVLKVVGKVVVFVMKHKDLFAPLAVGLLVVVSALTAATIAMKIFNAVMAVNPIALIVIAIAALVAGLVYFFTKTETGKKIVEAFSTWITEVFIPAIQGIAQWFVDAWNQIVLAWTGAGEWFGSVIEGILTFFRGLPGKIVKFFSDTWDKVRGLFNSFVDFVKNNWFIILLAVFSGGLVLLIGVVVRNWDKIKEFTQNLIDSVVKFFSELPGKIGTFFSDAWNKVKEIWGVVAGWFGGVVNSIGGFFNQVPGKASSAFTSAKNTVVNIWNAIPGWFNGIIKNIGNIANNVIKYFKDAFDKAVAAIKSIDWGGIGMDIIKGIGNGIAGMGKWLADKAKAAVGQAKDQLKSFLGIKSPSRVMRDEVGKMMGMGVAEGIDASTRNVMSSMKDLANVSVGNFDSSVNVQHGFSDFTDSGNSQPLIINVGGERLVDTVIEGINGRSFLGGSSVINV